MAAPFSLRPATPADDRFLFQLYASTRTEELAPFGWTASQRDLFLRQQFAACAAHYKAAFANATHSIVFRGKRPIGAMIISRNDDEIRLVDVALLPSHRSAGIGTQLLQGLIAEAQDAGLPLRLHVLKHNSAAVRLYLRLGFAPAGMSGLHLRMERQPRLH